jgi:hypothetical protein
MRIALVSTPRVGNTWIRHLLGTAYQIPHLAKHAMADSDWATLPSDVVLQMHWRREPTLQAKFAEHGFRVVTVARHPFDVLISILHFCLYDSESENWLLGQGGTEEPIWGAMPRSRSFINYALGSRAHELFAVTADWWGQPNVHGVKYEDFVAAPEEQMRKVEAVLGSFRAPLPAVIEQCSIGQLRQGARNNHFWKGQPGLWRQLIPVAETNELLATFGPLLAQLEYSAESDPHLNADTADANWIAMVGGEVKQTIRKLNETYRGELAAKDAHIADVTERFLALEGRVNSSLVMGGPVGRMVKGVLNRVRGRA